METFLIRAAQLILSLSILVIMHECGHFLFARLFKVRVERFYLFFNPSFSIFRMKKINGKWRFKFFAKNDKDTRTRINYNNEEVTEVVPTDELPDDNWKKYPESTEYGIGWLPLGGYVTIAGMIDESMNTAQMKQPAKPWEFRSKKAWQRLLIMIGGVTVNFILALVIYSAIMTHWGRPAISMQNTPMVFAPIGHEAGYEDGDYVIAADGKELGYFTEGTLLNVLEAKEVTVLRDGVKMNLDMPGKELMKRLIKEKTGFMSPDLAYPAVIDSVLPDSPVQGTLQQNDRIVALDTVSIQSYPELRAFLEANTEREIEVAVIRNGDSLRQQVTLNEAGLLGIYMAQPEIPIVKYDNFFKAIPAGITYGLDQLRYYVRQMKYVFTKEGSQEIGSFGALGKMFASKWNWRIFWENTAFISIILAFMNILPIPALDGGHVLFLLYEMITRRKPNQNFMIYAQAAGMILLLLIFVYALGMDIIRGLFG